MKDYIIVDLFCGSGMFTLGAIKGFDRATAEKRIAGRISKFIAVNHWTSAAATYEANHPLAEVYCQKIEAVHPREAVPGGRVDLLLASPECTHHSLAAGARPKNDQSRALGFDALNWMYNTYAPLVIMENVPEWAQWGPLDAHGHPIEKLKGTTFTQLIEQIKAMDYYVEWKILDASDYGGATSRKRLFMMCKRRGQGKIVWPEPTNGAPEQIETQKRQYSLFSIGEPLKPKRTAREIIDWSLKGTSIFNRDVPLAENTMKRIMAGLYKFSLKGFLVEAGGTEGKGRYPHSADEPLGTILTENHTALIEPCLIQFNRHCDGVSLDKQVPTITANGLHLGLMQPYITEVSHGLGDTRGYSTDEPMRTITGVHNQGLIEPYLIEYHSTFTGGRERLASLDLGLPTVDCSNRFGLVEPYLIKYYGNERSGESVNLPLDTITTKERFALCVPILTKQWPGHLLLDILFRMLEPHELAAAMGVPETYRFISFNQSRSSRLGKHVHPMIAGCTKRDAVKMIGNGVSVDLVSQLAYTHLAHSRLSVSI